MADSQDQLKKVKQEVEDEKAKIAALVGESSAELPEVAEMMSEKGKDGGPSKPAFKSAVVQPEPFKNPDNSPPPKSFQMCAEQAYLSAKAAIDAGHKLLEVEFPPLPQSAMDNGAIGAYTILDAQIQHARNFARFFEGKNVAIVFSDAEERNMFVDDETYGIMSPRRPGAVRYSALGGGWKGSWFSQIKVAEVQVFLQARDRASRCPLGASCSLQLLRLCGAASRFLQLDPSWHCFCVTLVRCCTCRPWRLS
jgi:hypothetical protein